MSENDTKPRDPQIQIPMSPEDKRLCEAAAAKKRMPLATWARMTLTEAAEAQA